MQQQDDMLKEETLSEFSSYITNLSPSQVTEKFIEAKASYIDCIYNNKPFSPYQAEKLATQQLKASFDRFGLWSSTNPDVQLTISSKP